MRNCGSDSYGDSYGLNIYVPLNSHVEALTLNVTVVGNRACEEVIKAT